MCRSKPTTSADKQRHDEKHQKNPAQDLGDPARRAGHAGKTEQAGCECNNQKHNGPVEHVSSCWPDVKGLPLFLPSGHSATAETRRAAMKTEAGFRTPLPLIPRTPPKGFPDTGQP